jgi:hypothetical protein
MPETPPPWRFDADPGLVLLAVGRCLVDVMDRGRWTELGLLTGTQERLQSHPRLLRALFFCDPDYDAAVYEVVPWLLRDGSAGATIGQRFPGLETVSTYAAVPAWLAQHDEPLFGRVCQSPDDHAATLPDGTVLGAAETAATRLEVAEMRRQVDRIRRDYADDPEALVGQVKELVETTCKTVLGLSGAGAETRRDVPQLVDAALRHLGVHPADLTKTGDDATEAQALKRLFGGLASVLSATAELRNARGTGHGRSGAPLVDASLARMTAGMALAGVVYLCETFDARTAADAAIAASEGDRVNGRDVAVGSRVAHSTFGQGQVIQTRGAGDTAQAQVDFGGETGEKWLLLRYAPMRLVRR